MNYSLLEDAWGNQNNLTSQYNKYMSDNIYIQNKQNCTNLPQQNMSQQQQNINQQQNMSQQQQNVQLNMNPLPIQSVPMENYNKPTQPIDNFSKYREVEHFTEGNDIECEKFMNHIKTCSKCFNKCKGLFRPKYMTHFHNFVDNNLDTIILILIFIFVLLCHNLLSNLIKSKA